jgi:hypothetical protein
LNDNKSPNIQSFEFCDDLCSPTGRFSLKINAQLSVILNRMIEV